MLRLFTELDITITSLDETHVKLRCDEHIIRELAEHFMFRPDGWRFNPKFKAGVWDGWVKLIQRNGISYKGLVPDIMRKAKSMGYDCCVDDTFQSFKEEIPFDHKSLCLELEPRDFQLAAVQRALTKKRQIILSATGSGKSLIMYMIARAVQERGQVLITVPTVSLVFQLYKDFEDYSKKDKTWRAANNVHMICEGQSKVTNKPIIISTWQSIQNQQRPYFEKFATVLSDECHTAKATVMSRILDNCVNANIRIGMTGTLDGVVANEMTLVSKFGPSWRASSSADLMEAGVLTPLEIKALILKYDQETSKAINGLPYKDEIDFIVSNKKRNKMIVKLATSLDNNTLVLYRFVEKHGVPLYQAAKLAAPEKKIFFVSGSVAAEVREKIREITEFNQNVTIFASYAIFSTGINIKNLHNVVFASPTKSKTTTLQSIGRGLRKHSTKETCVLYDIVDDFRGTRKKQNYTLQHFTERLRIYMAEQFPVKIKEIDF